MEVFLCQPLWLWNTSEASIEPVLCFVYPFALGMLKIQFPFVLKVQVLILFNIVQVTPARPDFVEIAMLTIYHFASDFSHIHHIILFN
jgi:hypothetical protein